MLLRDFACRARNKAPVAPVLVCEIARHLVFLLKERRNVVEFVFVKRGIVALCIAYVHKVKRFLGEKVYSALAHYPIVPVYKRAYALGLARINFLCL